MTISFKPPALLWLEEFEQANFRCSKLRLWRDFHALAKSRGTALVGGLDWPGSVYLPSTIVESLIKKETLKIPDRWSVSNSVASNSKIVSSLLSWELSRGIYQFTDISANLVINSCVTAKLKPEMFEGLSSHAVYIDLQNTKSKKLFDFFDQENKYKQTQPIGFFASIDQSIPGNIELILLVDRFSHLDVHKVELGNKTIDELVIQIKNKNSYSSFVIDHDFGNLEVMLNCAISAVLMTCISQTRMEILSEESDNNLSQGRNSWVNWEVGSGIDEQIKTETFRFKSNNSHLGDTSLVMGQWCEPLSQETLRFQFSAGCQLDWKQLSRRAEKRASDLNISKKID